MPRPSKYSAEGILTIGCVCIMHVGKNNEGPHRDQADQPHYMGSEGGVVYDCVPPPISHVSRGSQNVDVASDVIRRVCRNVMARQCREARLELAECRVAVAACATIVPQSTISCPEYHD